MAVATSGASNEAKRVTILGATGSIGCSTLDIVERNPDAYRIEVLTANRNVESLAEQARRFKPSLAVIADATRYGALKEALDGTGIEVSAGAEALVEAAARPVDFVMAGIVGAAGLAPTLAGIRQGAVVGLANKETLVCAGDLVLDEISRHGATLLPVDSEHNAIFQVFEFDQAEAVSRIILTASGGPFRKSSLAKMEAMSPEQAVAHPNWSMGAKISVDSATMMNKGLEVIEAFYLFPIEKDQIEIVVHPQSVIHSMVEYVDGSVLAQLGSPDMRTPIAYSLGWPARIDAPAKRLDFGTMGDLSFEAPDLERFPAIRLARAALNAGGSAPTVLNAANEIAVRGFLDRQIGFLDIAAIVEDVLAAIPHRAIGSLEDVYALDAEARREATERIGVRDAAQ
jgi:1-deoxy-D-xylulose-5-phosphate reductoisomerase